MNKKILLGSIIAVAILVLVSFTGVVGYQTTKSSTIAKASPLFSIRSKRAIDKERKDLTCYYVGKGEETNILFSSRIKRTEQAQKAINIISKMDDKAFSKFFARIILQLKNKEKMTSTEIIDVLKELQHVRRNPNVMDYYDTMNIPIYDTSEFVSCRWLPVCYIIDILLYIWSVISLIITGWITSLTLFGFTHCPNTCDCAI